MTYREPDQQPALSEAELKYIRAGQPVETVAAPKASWGSLLRNRAVWGYILASIFAGPAWGFYQFFLPDFLHKRFNPSLQAIGWYTALFFSIAAIGGVVGGWLPAVLLRKQWSLNKARKISLLVCAIAVLPIYLAPQMTNIVFAVLIVGVAASAHQGWSANMYCVASDTLPKAMVSSTIGLGGFVAYFTGGFVNEFTGLILQKTGSYQLVFGYFSTMYLLALVALQLLVPKIPEHRNVSETLEVESQAGHLITE
jgi:ACS family hexuronate transporter-like MFS transporter